MTNPILFLCTGNYYRSRFCEEYFNHRARCLGLPWRADSRGLAPDVDVFRNPGPISPATLQRLTELGASPGASLRYPRSVETADFDRADRIVALSRHEHQPMVERFFPTYGPLVEYWEVGDLPLETPAHALEKMTRLVERLVDELQPETERITTFAPAPAN
ncbi:MAG TPA: low molecular weight phosphatase family protein [Candidatus Competibacter phosphatis]|nr:low molecular weight phosphatase family protein [Candidatus Competibacter phosphatis]HMR03626.1 low molecular weight phosphatase family protein [Candidatus Competibacter phosphatis]